MKLQRQQPKPIRFTTEGYKKLEKEYQDLLKERPAIVEDVKKARDMGDLSENGYYKASKAKLGFIDGRLMRIKFTLKNAKIIEESEGDIIDIGKTVTLLREETEITYSIVGDLEANPAQGKLSLLSPLGKALYEKHTGDTAEIQTPKGTVVYTIIKIT